MYARTSTWAGTPEALESWIRHVKDKVGPMVADQFGPTEAVERCGYVVLYATASR